MSIPAGLLNRRVTLFRRAAMPATGTARGGYVAVEETLWAGYRPRAVSQFRVGGLTFNGEQGVLTLRDSSVTRTLESCDRFRMGTQMFEILGRQYGEVADGVVRFDVRSAPDAARYEHLLDNEGDLVTLNRVTSGGTVTARVRAWIRGFQPDEIVGGIQYGERRGVLLAKDVLAAGFPLPIRTNDYLMVDGTRRMNVLAPADDFTHRFGGEVYAYEVRLAGG